VTGLVTLAWREAFKNNKFSLSLASAYRWRNIFTNQIHHYRAKLLQQVPDPPPDPPPDKKQASSITLIKITINQFDEANPGKKIDSFSSFQLYHKEGFYKRTEYQNTSRDLLAVQ
jgi:hypothetical protein